MNNSLDQLIAESLRIPAERVTDTLEFQGAPEWDSVGHLSLILALEDRFQVTIPDDVVVELTTVRAIRTWAADKGTVQP